ncbi:hypothetical protein PLICRDRAFT_101348 [Plicaturopsis crispa FD-325 SS-3]|nr:hypothetical protein PLICRDRAFT_101348 [Plicaturopsis crispa FD-325 SS-3]
MSSVLTALFHRCPRQYTANSNFQALAFGRQFSTSHALLAPRKVTKIRTPSKKAMAAKLKKREKIERIEKMQYEKEKMPLNNALAVLRAVEVSRPKATYEITIKTQMKRATAVPKGRIKLPRDVKERPKDKILVFADGRAAEDAKKAGADIVGGAELVEAVVNGRANATIYLCTPNLIRAITPKLGRILGPRGLMPSERRGTVTDDIVAYIDRLQGSTEWKGDQSGYIRYPIAKLHWPIEDVERNIRHFITVVKRAANQKVDEGNKKSAAPATGKPVIPIDRVVLSSTQGPGIIISDF